MIDQSHIDLLQLIGINTTLEKVSRSSSRGPEYKAPCPFCGGTDRLTIHPKHPDNPLWCCRQCGKSGDAINYIQYRDNVSFREALQRLGLENHKQPHVSTKRAKPVKNGNLSSARRDPDWQRVASTFCDDSQATLWSDAGTRALKYLMEQRNLTANTIRDACLGFNPIPPATKPWWGDEEVWLPRSIVIPWYEGGQVVRVNMRRPLPPNSDECKYIQAKGGANAIYRADYVQHDGIVLLVEGEFDALCAQQEIGPNLQGRPFTAVATGSTTGGRLLRYETKLGQAHQVILTFDEDQAGQQATAYWQKRLGSKAVVHATIQHDITDMLQAGENIRDWLLMALS